MLLPQRSGLAPTASSMSPKTRPESWASSSAVRNVMRGNKGRDTRPELALRSAVHALGMRYRVGLRPVPRVRRTADIVFTKARVAVFLDGCFWHGCPDHHRPARKNSDFWITKIEGNRARDADTDSLLRGAGWQVLRIWEHEDPVAAARTILKAIRERNSEDVTAQPGAEGRNLSGNSPRD
jgi:DNA mismatch endonuclease, patch repair protein